MSDLKSKDQLVPPSLPGIYRIRDADGDIIYWGDSKNLYGTWSEKVQNNLLFKQCAFEFSTGNKFDV